MTNKVQYWYSLDNDDYIYPANNFDDAKEQILIKICNEKHSKGNIIQVCNNVATFLRSFTIEDTFYKVFKECEHVASFRFIKDATKYAKQFDCFVYIETFDKRIIWSNF